MPRRPKPEEIDFDIHVDPSCLSAPIDQVDDTFAMTGRESLPMENTPAEDAIDALETEIREQLDQALDSKPKTEDHDTQDNEHEEGTPTQDQNEPSADEQTLEANTDDQPLENTSVLSEHAPEEASVLSSGVEEEHATELAETESETVMPSIEGDSLIEPEETENRGEEAEDREDSVLVGESHHSDSRLQTPDPSSRRDSYLSTTSATSSPRRASGRTEALIHAAARDIVAQIEQVNEPRDMDETEQSFISETNTLDHRRDSEAYTVDESRRSSQGGETEQARSADEGAYSSSHHENEDDVFSDHSPRSSVGSASDAAASDADVRKMDENVTRRSRTRSPRVSAVSGFSQYEHEEDGFIPTVRGTPRPAFRSPSSVKAMQMSSPPASVFGSPRSSRRTPLPTVSRLGSPGISAQYSPKKTPPRFKRNTPPLVLLHVTLLPLRWPWADVLEYAGQDELSADGRNLKDAWTQLQDRMGDTTCERGILLPHPQNDYEVLEERLLEALELPLRRRARILECGHYLGPANDLSILDDSDDSEEDFDDDTNFVVHSPGRKMHWCSTCCSDIRYDSLGADKVFRVKVYASNGLMKAGAWDTCWKEMERVDVEIEPLVEISVQHELARLQAEQERRLDEEHALELRQEPAPDADYGHVDEVPSIEVEDVEEEPSHIAGHEEEPSTQETRDPVPPASPEESRRQRDEERLREIYGHEPPATHPQPDSPDPSFTAHTSPASPSVEAYERRQERARSSAAQAYKTASLPELLFESIRVLLQDRKNVVILVMGVLVALLALRAPTGASARDMDPAREIEKLVERREAVIVPSQDTSSVILEETVAPPPAQHSVESVETVAEQSADPCTASLSNAPEVSVSQEIIRVVETITETAIETATVTQTFTAVETESMAPIASGSAVPVEAESATPVDPEDPRETAEDLDADALEEYFEVQQEEEEVTVGAQVEADGTREL
ncbi:translation initiation factor eIF2B [Sarocladium implicatum]|nr:translation initiation factor eIF2B [Sarocladium implicatum]